uniref:Glycosyltransferase family 2 protein n=1 Tax=Ignisphaera aggregans TaxID=334771 RepID=A0A7C4FES3_9CREN
MSYRYVTIIIPVHNSEKTLLYVLNSIKLLNYPHKYIKIVVVDDCSEDRTLQIAVDFKYENEANFHSIEVVRLGKKATTSEARNEGIKRAIPGSYLLFLDSDVILKPDTLNRLMEIAESSPEVGAVGALYLTSSPSLSEISVYYRYLGRVSEGPAGTGALLVKWEVFEKVSFFNERLGYPKTIYEDLEYVMRIRRSGYKVLIDGREPLPHFKPALSEEVLIKGSKSESFIQLLKHLVSYFSLRKAFALHEVLKVAPIRYKLEYATYFLLLPTLALTSLYSLTLPLLLASGVTLIASLHSLITYPKSLNLVLRILAGPAILLSRVLRALTLAIYLIIRPLYSGKLT